MRLRHRTPPVCRARRIVEDLTRRPCGIAATPQSGKPVRPGSDSTSSTIRPSPRAITARTWTPSTPNSSSPRGHDRDGNGAHAELSVHQRQDRSAAWSPTVDRAGPDAFSARDTPGSLLPLNHADLRSAGNARRMRICPEHARRRDRRSTRSSTRSTPAKCSSLRSHPDRALPNRVIKQAQP